MGDEVEKIYFTYDEIHRTVAKVRTASHDDDDDDRLLSR